MEITAKAPKINKTATVNYNVGTNLDENIEIFGAERVNSLFVEQLTVKVQAGIRRCIEGDIDPQSWADGYKPGDRAPSIAKNPKAAARAAIGQMTEEEKLELIALLQSQTE